MYYYTDMKPVKELEITGPLGRREIPVSEVAKGCAGIILLFDGAENAISHCGEGVKIYALKEVEAKIENG